MWKSCSYTQNCLKEFIISKPTIRMVYVLDENIKMLEKTQLQELIKELVDELNLASQKYYSEENESHLSDEEYDEKSRLLKELEKEYPQFIPSNSPTKNIGAALSNSVFQPFEHPSKNVQFRRCV